MRSPCAVGLARVRRLSFLAAMIGLRLGRLGSRRPSPTFQASDRRAFRSKHFVVPRQQPEFLVVVEYRRARGGAVVGKAHRLAPAPRECTTGAAGRGVRRAPRPLRVHRFRHSADRRQRRGNSWIAATRSQYELPRPKCRESAAANADPMRGVLPHSRRKH